MNKHLNWVEAISLCKKSAKPWVLATVIGAKGSTPRECGSKMLITEDKIYDTIGGGQLEYAVVNRARELLQTGANQQSFEHFPLAAKTQQCCGGVMNVMLECFAVTPRAIHIFGAGHVAKALVSILGQWDARIYWVDSRPDEFPADIPRNTQICHYPDVLEHVKTMEPNAYSIILTHQHVLDYQIVEALLDRKDCHFIGLIGSQTKAKRFQKRLRSASFMEGEINHMHCPIGLPDIGNKQPIEVAVSISAQIMQLTQKEKTSTKNQHSSGISWRQLSQQTQQYGLQQKLPHNKQSLDPQI